MRHKGELRCKRCWRVCRFYPQAIWHYPTRRIGLDIMTRLRNGGTV